MTRKSKREIERAVDELQGEGHEYSVSDLMWANLKDYYGARLSPAERRLLEDPDRHLPPEAAAQIDPARFKHGGTDDT